MAIDAHNAMPQGNLDMLILRTLQRGAHHGYAIARHLYEASNEFFQIEEGSLYPALHRLEQRGLIASEWGVSESNRKAKYYTLTAAGKKQLRTEITAWQNVQRAIASILDVPALEARS